MAGRGRGGTFTQEQMQKLTVGIGSAGSTSGGSSKDVPQVTNIPPPTYPPLTTTPVYVELDNEYEINWKDRYTHSMQESPYHKLKHPDQRVIRLNFHTKKKMPPEKENYPWERMPSELKSVELKRKVRSKTATRKKSKTQNIEGRLKVLEEKERTGDGQTKPPAKDDSDSDEAAEDEEGIPDEEMDDENDYGNSYFDNGESYNDEDDNLDDGPVY